MRSAEQLLGTRFGDGGGGIFDFDDSVTEALKMTEGERENVRRIAIRLEQGATAANCDKICRALKVSHVNATT